VHYLGDRWDGEFMKKPMDHPLRSAFQGKRVLVTGHSGFKGSWLCKTLDFFGAKVYGFSISPPIDSRHSYFELEISKIILNSHDSFGDVRDQDFNYTLKSENFDYIFHLAAQSLVAKSFEDPGDTFTTNIVGTIAVLEHLRKENSKATCLIITSDKCYKNYNTGKSFIESDVLGGSDPYSASKASAEIIFQSYIESFPNLCSIGGIASARAGNVFGGGDWSENRLIPDCARFFSQDKTVLLRMPHATRPWTSVHDIINGYLILAAKLRSDSKNYRGSWNFSSSEIMSVFDVATIFRDGFGQGNVAVEEKLVGGKESILLQIDSTKSKSLLYWDVKKNLEKSLKETSRWYLAQSQGEDMKSYSEKYLMEYFHA